MKKLINSVLAICMIFSSIYQGQAQKKDYQVACIAFYNVENLFDTEDDPLIRDEEYTPDGSRSWDLGRYETKVANMAYVISQLGLDKTQKGASIVGLCEIENRKVLEDLVAHDFLKERNYQIVHKNSPDKRGIDVALIYQKDHFELTDSTSHLVRLMRDTSYYPTRDVLHVAGKLDGEEMHFIVNHWPSRRGGEKRSSAGRELAASVNKYVVDSLMNIDIASKIIIMGDLNDNPSNKSVKTVLGAKEKVSDTKEGQLYNPMMEMFDRGVGSNAYRDTWSIFDQMIVSEGLLDKKQKGYFYYQTTVFNKRFLIQKRGHFKGYPFRTFGGSEYQGGYSDHFPVFTYLLKSI